MKQEATEVPHDAARAEPWHSGRGARQKLPIADVIDGELKAVPRAVHAAATIMDGARGGVKVPAADVGQIKSHLAKYYAKMGEAPPWDR